MIGVDVILAISTATLAASYVKDYLQKKRIEKLQKEKEQMQEVAESLIDTKDEKPKYDHSWLPPTEDVIFKSINPLSNDVVVARSAVCNKCQVVHRYIVRGQSVAEKNSLNVDGFYMGGVRVPERGCSIKGEKSNLFTKKLLG